MSIDPRKPGRPVMSEPSKDREGHEPEPTLADTQSRSPVREGAGEELPATIAATVGLDATIDSLPVGFPAPGTKRPPGDSGAGEPGIAASGIIEGTEGFVLGPVHGPSADDTGNRELPTIAATGVFVPEQAAIEPNALAKTDLLGDTGVFEPTQSGPPSSRRSSNRPSDALGVIQCGRYILKNFHARGGMGEIWMAVDPDIGRPVALKRMLGKRADQQSRFRLEAQVTGQLEHPGIVPVHELGLTDEGHPFYAMKFVQGRTLQKVIEGYHAAKPRGGTREVEQMRLLQIFLSLCQTVAYAHSRGVLHRDLKPENVMLGSYGETILLDWGIAKVMGQKDHVTDDPANSHVRLTQSSEDTETQVGAIMGTPSYMAPEVASGLNAEVDERSDVYLLGSTLYEILTGVRPRKAKTIHELIKLAQEQPPVPAVKVCPDVPKALDAICRKAMALYKDDRYQSALELADDIQRFVAGEPVSAYREDFPTRAWRWAKRHRKALSRSAAAVVIIGLSTFAVAKIRESELRRLEAQREARVLKEQDQARRDLKAFRRLADEARFYAATTDPVSEHAPYYDPRKGEETALAALRLAGQWGPSLGRMPLPDERPKMSQEISDLILLTAHVKCQRKMSPAEAGVMLALLDQARRLNGPSRSYYRLHALAYHQLGESEKAIVEEWEAADYQGPATAQDLFLLGEKLRKEAEGRADGENERAAWEPDPMLAQKAIEQYREALMIQPDHYWSHFQLGRSYMSLGRFAEAIESLGACVALRPDSPWGYGVRGLALAQQKRLAEAERDLARAIQLDPNSRTTLLNRGVVSWNQKKYKEAFADFDAVLQPPKEKRLIEAAFYRGQMYLQLNEVTKGLEDFDRVVAESPSYRSVYRYRAQTLIALGHNARALEDLDAYLAAGGELDPVGWMRHGQHGRWLRLLYGELPAETRGKPEGRAVASLALDELKKAVESGGRAPQIFDDLGAILELVGQRDAAIAAYSKGLEIDPKHARLLIKRGWAFESINQHGKALSDFTLAAQSEPENAEAHTGLGYVRALDQRPAEAQREAELALLHGSDQYLVLHNVACIYAALSQPADRQSQANQDVAIAILRRAVDLWKRERKAPNEIDLIKSEPAFHPMRDRADFRELIDQTSAHLDPKRSERLQEE